MTYSEAKHLIELLANGINPETGEILPRENPFNNPPVIRALFVAVKALERMEDRERRLRALPSNAGKAWSKAEDDTLLAAFDAGITARAIASKHGRTVEAIVARLVRLGRIKERTDVYKGT